MKLLERGASLAANLAEVFRGKAVESERKSNAKRIRPRVGWLHIGRTRAQVRDASKVSS